MVFFQNRGGESLPIRFVDKTCRTRPDGAWFYSGRAALLRGPSATAAQQRRPTVIVKQPDRHGRIYEKRVLVHTRLFSTKTRILSHEKNIPSGFTEVSISLYGQKGADLSIRSSQLPMESDWCAASGNSFGKDGRERLRRALIKT